MADELELMAAAAEAAGVHPTRFVLPEDTRSS